MKHLAGLTLIELLTCLVIVALLSACAVPLHRDAVRRVRRGDARVALLNLQTLEERYYFLHGHYAGSLAELGNAAELAVSEAGFYRIELRPRAADAGYLALATPRADGPQSDDESCRLLWLDDRGRRSAEGSVTAERKCWS